MSTRDRVLCRMTIYLYRSELVEEVVHVDSGSLYVTDGLLELGQVLVRLVGDVRSRPWRRSFDQNGDELEVGVDEGVEESLERCLAV
jgi:hypothetical protein